jgi:hypothetical protein
LAPAGGFAFRDGCLVKGGLARDGGFGPFHAGFAGAPP